jgi:hypothetical protein
MFTLIWHRLRGHTVRWEFYTLGIYGDLRLAGEYPTPDTGLIRLPTCSCGRHW